MLRRPILWQRLQSQIRCSFSHSYILSSFTRHNHEDAAFCIQDDAPHAIFQSRNTNFGTYSLSAVGSTGRSDQNLKSNCNSDGDIGLLSPSIKQDYLSRCKYSFINANVRLRARIPISSSSCKPKCPMPCSPPS
jgi:hypothetical protein